MEDSGRSQKVEGQITLHDADTALPECITLRWCPGFTPNQDSIHDRVSISYYLTKQPSGCRCIWSRRRTQAGQPKLKYPIAEVPTSTTSVVGEAGYHGYDYDGGVDLNAEPPPDGDYVIYGMAEDKVGNRVVVSSTLTIKEGGKPRAEVVGGEIHWRDSPIGRRGAVGPHPCFTATERILARCRFALRDRGRASLQVQRKL